MESPVERRGWIDEHIAGRTFGSQLSVWTCPEMSIKDVALHEALNTFVLGLFVSTVLDAYAACEIWLVERIVSHAGMGERSGISRDAASVQRAWDEAVAKYGTLGRTKEILREFRNFGNWIPPETEEPRD